MITESYYPWHVACNNYINIGKVIYGLQMLSFGFTESFQSHKKHAIELYSLLKHLQNENIGTAFH